MSSVPDSASPEEHAALLQLCQRNGVAVEYYDIWGNRRAVPEYGLRALLRAMDIEAGNRAQIDASLAAGEAAAQAALRIPLPPVAVFWQDSAPWRLALQVAARDGELQMGADREGGTRHQAASTNPTSRCPPRCRWAPPARPAPPVPGAEARRWPDARHHGAAALLYPPRLHDGGPVWGSSVSFTCCASARTGHRRFTDLARRRWPGGRRRHRRPEPAELALYRTTRELQPLSPSSWRFLDVLYIDVEAVPESELFRAACGCICPAVSGAPAPAARARQGGLPRRGRGQDARARTPVRGVLPAAPCRCAAPARARLCRLRAGRRRGAAPARAVRGAAGELLRAEPAGLGLAPMAL